MKRFRLSAIAALLAAAWCAPFAAAQTQNIATFSGNGQLICPSCTFNGVQFFDNLVARVTDASGNPVSGATVNWSVSGQGYLSTYSTTTAADGTTSNTFGESQYNVGSTLQPFYQSTIVASTVSGATATFYETETSVPNGISNSSGDRLVFVYVQYASQNCPTCASVGDPTNPISGTAGSTSNQQVVIDVETLAGSTPAVVPNVAVRLLPDQGQATASCATGLGADPGSVLTDVNGRATCNVVLGPLPGSGTVKAAVGGVAVNNFNSTSLGYELTGDYILSVTPGTPGGVTTIIGNAQTANPGQALPLALVAVVGDQNGNPLPSQQVAWSVSPAGAATLTGTTTTSDANGQVRTNVTLASSAVGAVKITVTLTGNNKFAAVFTETANVQVTGLSIISGNNQTAIVNAGFASPLIVQLTTSSGTPTAGVPVQFTLAGPGTLSTPNANTGSNGQAQVNVTATATTGTITVTASAGLFSQAFTLTVIPAGPSLSTNSFYNGADFQRSSISPCSIATIIAPGIAPTLQGAVEASMVGPLPYLMAGDSVTINGSQAPIFNVANTNGQQQVTFQIPCGLTAGTASVTVNVSGGTATISVPLNPVSPGIFGTTQTNGTYLPVLVRPDGSFVSQQNPSRRGETVVAFVTGMGPTSPGANTNSLPIPGSAANVQGTVVVGFAGGGIPFTSAQLSPDLIGVYEVSFQIPSNAPTGNLTFSIGVLPAGSGTIYYSALGTFPVQ